MDKICAKRGTWGRRLVSSSLVLMLVLCGLGERKNNMVDASADEKSQLTFSADCLLVSEPMGDNASELRQFLERPDVRNLFLSAGGERPCQILPHDDTMMTLWRGACARFYGQDALPLPSEEIAILATDTSAQFPGFRSINTVVNGCRTFASQHHGGLGERLFHWHPGKTTAENQYHDTVHKFFLIADKKRWEGPRPVVWLVKKLTGDAGKEKHFRPCETRAIAQVSIVPSNGTSKVSSSPMSYSTKQNPMYSFQLDIECAVQIEFPRILLKLLPAPRSKVEESGTKAVRKAIMQDATAAMSALQSKWANEQEATQVQKSSAPSHGGTSILGRPWGAAFGSRKT